MCVSALVTAAVFPPRYWDKDDMDAVLMEGDRRHREILTDKGWPRRRHETKMAIDEMPEQWDIKINGKKLVAKVQTVSTNYGLMTESVSLVNSILKQNTTTPCVLRLYDSFVAVLPGDKQSFYLFDPHARNANGEIDPDGVSCLLHFKTRHHLAQYIKRQAGPAGSTEQIDINLMTVNLLTGIPF